MLKKHANLREDFLAGDVSTIKSLAAMTAPDKVLARVKGPWRDERSVQRNRDSRTVHTNWMKGFLTPFEIDKITENLMQEWQITESGVASRLLYYAQSQGLVTSPGPLLSDDKDILKSAASLICGDCPSGRHRPLGPKFPGTNDALHQPSETFGNESGGPYFIDYEEWQSTSIAQRFRSQKWHDNYSPAAIKSIHAAVVRHWVPWLNAQFVNRQLKKVNEYLQVHQDLIERIYRGDEEAAYQVAGKTLSTLMLKRFNNDWRRLEEEGAAVIKTRVSPLNENVSF